MPDHDTYKHHAHRVTSRQSNPGDPDDISVRIGNNIEWPLIGARNVLRRLRLVNTTFYVWIEYDEPA